jgi:type I restriction enzyme S subunit
MSLKFVKLKDCCEIKPPKSEAKKFLAQTDLVSFVPMRSLGINTVELELKDDRALSAVSGSYTYFAENDVLLAKITPCFENGKLGIARGLTNGIGFGSSEFIVFRPSTELLAEYLYYFLLRPIFREQGQAVMTGAVGHKRVPKDYIESSKILLPPLEEQKRIVAILDQVFADIEKARAAAETNLKNARELFDSYLQNIFTIPSEDWKKGTLGSLGTITSSKRIFKKEYVDDGVPFYRTKEIKQLANRKKITTELFITDERYNDIISKSGKPGVGDVLLTAIGTIGEIYVVEESSKFYFKDGNVLWLKDYVNLNSEFLKFALKTFISELNRLSHGSAYNALPINKLKEYVVHYPTINEQEIVIHRILKIQESVIQLSSTYQKKVAKFEELKKCILQKAFTGKLTKSEGTAA